MKPLLLHYFITNRCNQKCLFCDIWKEQPKEDAQTADVLFNLAHARKAGCKFVDFTGGEPLLHPELPLYLKKARELGYITSVTTNAILFPQQAHKLAGCIDLLHFSIDADNPQLHDTIHGCKSYDAVMESIPIALSHKLVPDLLFTYSDRNIDSFIGIYEYARKNKLMVILDPIFNLEGKDSVSPETHQKALKYSRLSGVYVNKAHLLLRKHRGNNTKKTFCRAVSSTVVILPDNTLALPCYHHRITSVKLVLSLTHVINHAQRLKALQEQGTYSFCEGCHINCYFDPSYSFLCNTLFIKSITAKFGYAMQKYFIYGHPIPLRW